MAQWIDLFVDFLVTKHGLAQALQSDDAAVGPLHAYFLERLVPICAQLLDAAVVAGEVRRDVNALELMRGVGNLCIGSAAGSGYDARKLVALLLDGLCAPRGTEPPTQDREDQVRLHQPLTRG